MITFRSTARGIGTLAKAALVIIFACSGQALAAGQDFSATRLGMQPAHGDTVKVNPPYFAWGPKAAETSYRVELSRSADFGDRLTVFSQIPYCIFRPRQTLAPGRWYWRVAAVQTGGLWSTDFRKSAGLPVALGTRRGYFGVLASLPDVANPRPVSTQLIVGVAMIFLIVFRQPVARHPCRDLSAVTITPS